MNAITPATVETPGSADGPASPPHLVPWLAELRPSAERLVATPLLATVLLVAGLLIVARPPAAQPTGPGAGAATPVAAMELLELAPGVLMHRAPVALAAPGNAGDIANLGVVIGSRCVAVIDTGGSAVVGMALRSAITERTGKPVCYVVNTHGHPDHHLGNSAFRGDTPQFVGHANLARAMAARGANYLNAARRDIGPAAGALDLVPPTVTVDDRLELDLGERKLVLQAWPPAHTDQDLTVFDPTSGALFLGDLVVGDHLPVLDGNLKGWLSVLDSLAQSPAKLAIPGHGQAADLAALLEPQRAYLVSLRDRVKAAIKRRESLAATVDSLASQVQGKWALSEQFHRRNVTAAYAELEWDE